MDLDDRRRRQALDRLLEGGQAGLGVVADLRFDKILLEGDEVLASSKLIWSARARAESGRCRRWLVRWCWATGRSSGLLTPAGRLLRVLVTGQDNRGLHAHGQGYFAVRGNRRHDSQPINILMALKLLEQQSQTPLIRHPSGRIS